MAFTEQDVEFIDRGIELFNSGRYFEAHEAWEKPWLHRGECGEKDFLQGLIMAAGAFHHYTRKECAGAEELLARSIERLKAAQEVCPGIDTAAFVSALAPLRGEFSRCSFAVPLRELPHIARRGEAGRCAA